VDLHLTIAWSCGNVPPVQEPLPIADLSLVSVPLDDDVATRVLAIVSRIAGPRRTPADPGVDTRLWGGGFSLDSIELLHVLIACDEAFGVARDGQRDVLPEALATVGSLAAALEDRTRR
jgi:acyl carrier protein